MKIHLGCNNDIREGFINIDLVDKVDPNYIQWDLRKGLPDSIRDVELVYSSHVLEHLMYDDCLTLLTDCFNRMRRGGIIRTSMPDFIKTFRAYIDNDLDWFNELWYVKPQNITGFVNASIYQYSDGVNEHKCIWSARDFIKTLEGVGFTNCREVEFDENYDPVDPIRRKYSFYVQAEKP